MRISTTQVYTQGVQAFGVQQTKLSHLQQQISTGIRITKPSDDPAAAARVLELQQSLEIHEQYQLNIDQANYRLDLQESSLASAENIMIRIKELTIQSNSAAFDSGNRQAIAAEVDQLYEQMLSIANTRDANGDYLFAGYQNQAQPFTETITGSITHVVFNGDDGQRSLQISQTRQINIDTAGRNVFMSIPSTVALNETSAIAAISTAVMAPAHVFDNSVYVADSYQIVFNAGAPQTYDVTDSGGSLIVDDALYTGAENIDFQGIRTSITGVPQPGDTFSISPGKSQDVFSIISSLSETLRSAVSGPQRTANYAKTLEDIDAGFTKMLDARTIIGGRMNALDAQQNDNEAFNLVTTETISVLRDTDLAEAISQLTLEQTTLDAAQAIFARITSSSLFNFLR